jgi:O-antigen ligase
MIGLSESPAAAAPVRTAAANGFGKYMRVAAMITATGYSLGYSTIGFGLLLGGMIWSLASRRALPWARTPLDFPLAAFGAVLLASAAASPYPRVAFEITSTLIVSGSIYYGSFAWLLNSDPDLAPALLRSWAAGGVLAAAAGFVYSAAVRVPAGALGHLVHPRAQIPHGVGPNGLGTTLALSGILSLDGALRGRGAWRVVWGLCSVASLIGLVATGSRASLAGWLLGCAYLVLRELRGRPGAIAVMTLAGMLLLGGVVLETPQLSGRLQDTMSDVAGNRVKIWQTSLTMIARRPMLGTGFGTFEKAYEEYRAPGMSPEPFAFNLWLNLAVETGMLGVAAALWVTARAILAWRRRRAGHEPADLNAYGRDFGPAVVSALWIGLIVDQFADNTLFSISTSAALWLLLALTMITGRAPSPDTRRDFIGRGEPPVA